MEKKDFSHIISWMNENSVTPEEVIKEMKKIISARSETRAKLVEMVSKRLDVNEEDVVDDADFQKDLGTDSLDAVELMMDAERCFKITITDEEAGKVRTFGDFLQCVEEKLK